MNKNNIEFRINSPCEFRLITVQAKGPILYDLTPGEYVGIEMLTFDGYPQPLINEGIINPISKNPEKITII